MDNAKRELWGTTYPSILASCGLLLTFSPIIYDSGFNERNLVSLMGLGMIITAIFMNRKKGLSGKSLEIKRRWLNYKIHIGMLIVAVCNTILSNYLWRS